MRERLCLENTGLLWYWAKRYAPLCRERGDIDADDLVQAGFLGLLEASESWQEDQGAWSTWASYRIRGRMREAMGRGKLHRMRMVSLDAPVRTGEDDPLGALIPDERLPELDAGLLRDDLVRAVREAVEAIGEDLPRQAVKYFHLEGKSYAEAAQAMGVRREAMSNLLLRGRMALKTNCRLRQALPELDASTRFYAHKGVEAFMRDQTSVVEAAVLWREEQREKAGGTC